MNQKQHIHQHSRRNGQLPAKTIKSATNWGGLHSDEKGLERIVLFSDAVFAIAITLLALEIRLPVEASRLTDQQLLTDLVAIWPQYLSFGISFLVIGSFWIAHHRRFSLITRYDNRLLLLNLLVLMAIAFIPFPTSVISENGNRTATIFYALTITVTGLLSALLWWYAAWENRLVDKNVDKTIARRNLISILTTPAVFLLSIGLTFINPDLGKVSWILTAPAALMLR
ncbi:MAG: DUF1211 domain-containing protein [Anaerolineales bacterium]|nr:DUF1211 domain-containing protein [Anaerolineales bacterium]